MKSSCRHCGLPVPLHAQDDNFCCQGCGVAYKIFHDLGLTDYYRVRDQLGTSVGPATASQRNYVELDDPSYWAGQGRLLEDETVSLPLRVEGMECAACAWALEQVLIRQPGVLGAGVQFAQQGVQVHFDPQRVKVSSLAKELDPLGYRLCREDDPGQEDRRRGEDHRLWARIGVAGAIFLNVMIFQIPLHLEAWQELGAAYGDLFSYLSALLTFPVVVYAATPFHRAAWRSLRSGILHIDLPISLAVIAAYCGSLYNIFQTEGEVYFDSVAGLVFFLLIGRAVVRLGQRRAERASMSALDIGGRTARVIRKGRVEEVPVSQILRGDEVEIEPDGLIPVDGEVLIGASFVDESLLTGESAPVYRRQGDSVVAGSRNVSGRIVVRADAVREERRLARVIRKARIETETKKSLAGKVHQLAGWFTAANLTLSLGTFVIWRFMLPEVALDRALAVAVVLCPCALGLASPLAYSVARARAAQAGAIVKNGRSLEVLAELMLYAFDKTGTLTHGRLRVVNFEGQTKVGTYSTLTLVAALEQRSNHPVARSFDPFLQGESVLTVSEVEEEVGRGIRGVVEGFRIEVGPASDEDLVRWGRRQDTDRSMIRIALDGNPIAWVEIQDELREESIAAIAELQLKGIECVILSGDRKGVTESVAATLGVENRYSEMDPEAKRNLIQSFQKEAKVVGMVGDGMNDTASFGVADVSIAVSSAAETALEVADIALTQPGLQPLLELQSVAFAMLKTLKRNFGLSAMYNIAGAAAAVVGLIGPLEAAILMPISSITVVLSSLWLDRT